uniref:Uncharacterized protein n=1 Tax=Anguilla anguilla TaxID=7936 RepID=A0A0E9X3H0_ANGAN
MGETMGKHTPKMRILFGDTPCWSCCRVSDPCLAT